MEHILRCNTLKCRQELGDQALVTTCSHCFCVECANQFQLLSRQNGQYPACPACQMHLSNPDDAVLATLNPTEDYKTSVLSGLSPNTVIECAGRALSFWAYQTTQEIVYQEYCVKNLSNKYAALNTQMDKIIHDANAELSNLRSKISNMQSEQDNLRQKNRDIAQQLRDRTRKHHETQELYDKLKRRNLLNHVQEAASDAVEQTIQNSVTTNRYMDANNNQNSIIPPLPLFSSHQSRDTLNAEVNYSGITNGGPQIDKRFSNYYRSGTIRGNQMQTPSTHRTKFPHGNFHSQIGPTNVLDRTTIQQQCQISPRDPLSNLSNNNNSGFTGYGMSAGLKVSNSMTVPNGSSRPILRSRVSQRQSSGHLKDESMKFDISKSQNIFANMNGNH